MHFMDRLHAHDVGLWNFFQAIHRPWLDPVVLALGNFGNLPALLVLVLLLGLFFLFNHKGRIVTFLLACFAGGCLLTFGGQWLVGRARPEVVLGLLEAPPTRYAYPSEHTLLATVIYLALAFILADLWPARARPIFLLAAAVILLVGLSRLYIGSCFPTDVIGAWLGGSAWVLLCRHVAQRSSSLPTS